VQTLNQGAALRTIVARWRAHGASIALVPTLGNLHVGHLALVEQAVRMADHTVVTIFVNPTQFVAGEDYEHYPRTLAQDSLLLSENRVDVLFTPTVKEIYPAGLDKPTRVEVPMLDTLLCGAFRPGHFTGVATVVTKLLNLVQPTVAIFGEKDYQQLLVIKRLVNDLCIPVEIRSVPTVRAPDGLAMSSRNSYLSTEERQRAPLLYQTLKAAAEAILRGDNAFAAIEDRSMETLKATGFKPDYFAVRRAEDLGLPEETPTDRRILAAAWLGQARLIDNIAVPRSALNLKSD
jgi:pantoate--beta-alanine ligase